MTHIYECPIQPYHQVFTMHLVTNVTPTNCTCHTNEGKDKICLTNHKALISCHYTVKTDVLWWHKNVLWQHILCYFLSKMDNKQHKLCYHSTSILTVQLCIYSLGVDTKADILRMQTQAISRSRLAHTWLNKQLFMISTTCSHLNSLLSIEN